MVIEFIGSTGAGKTTLISEIRRRLAKTANVTTPFDLVAAPLGLRSVTHPTVRNVIQDCVGLPFFLCNMYKHRAFILFALTTLVRHRNHTLFTANYLRSVVRRIGTYEIIRRYKRDRIVLVDEGTVSSVHLLFVFSSTMYSEDEIDQFANLVPLPELVVCLKAPIDSLVERALHRSDVREMRSQNKMVIQKYVSRASEIFDRLTQAMRVRDRLVHVPNPDCSEVERGEVAERIAEFILHYRDGVKQISTMARGREAGRAFTYGRKACQYRSNPLVKG